ncbi:MAG: hypothetical protein HC846_12050 [Blastocatellia bacterium]|nr:hypothetical protein [Blastocatellia bacterium]
MKVIKKILFSGGLSLILAVGLALDNQIKLLPIKIGVAFGQNSKLLSIPKIENH